MLALGSQRDTSQVDIPARMSGGWHVDLIRSVYLLETAFCDVAPQFVRDVTRDEVNHLF